MQASSTLLHNSTKPPLNQAFHTIQSERTECSKNVAVPVISDCAPHCKSAFYEISCEKIVLLIYLNLIFIKLYYINIRFNDNIIPMLGCQTRFWLPTQKMLIRKQAFLITAGGYTIVTKGRTGDAAAACFRHKRFMNPS